VFLVDDAIAHGRRRALKSLYLTLTVQPQDVVFIFTK
jgi:hypothetical protein